MRFSPAFGLALHVFAADPAAPRYGLEVAHASGLRTGTVYPLLRRMVKAGYLCAQWEDGDAAALASRTRRCYYTLTEAGRKLAVGQPITVRVGGQDYHLVPVSAPGDDAPGPGQPDAPTT